MNKLVWLAAIVFALAIECYAVDDQNQQNKDVAPRKYHAFIIMNTSNDFRGIPLFFSSIYIAYFHFQFQFKQCRASFMFYVSLSTAHLYLLKKNSLSTE